MLKFEKWTVNEHSCIETTYTTLYSSRVLICCYFGKEFNMEHMPTKCKGPMDWRCDRATLRDINS